MDALKPPGAAMADSATPGELKLLVDAAGRRHESWRRLQDAPGDVYSCDTAELHERIVIEFTREYVSVVIGRNMELISDVAGSYHPRVGPEEPLRPLGFPNTTSYLDETGLDINLQQCSCNHHSTPFRDL